MWEKQEYEMPDDVLFARPTNRAIKSGMLYADDLPRINKNTKKNFLLIKIQLAIAIVSFLLVFLVKTLMPGAYIEFQKQYGIITGSPLTQEQQQIVMNFVDEATSNPNEGIEDSNVSATDDNDNVTNSNSTSEITAPQTITESVAQGTDNSGYEKFVSNPASETDYTLPISVISPIEIGYITSEFGSRISPITGQPEFHSGLDIAAADGTEVLTVADGKVVISNYDSISGYYVKVDHGSGFVTGYAHLDSYLVKEGDTVKAGEAIGIIGSTGASTGTHLHLSFVLDGVWVDPILSYPNGLFS